MNKTIIFRIFNSLPEAQYVKDALEQNGVPCFIANQIGAQLYPIYASSVSGYQLTILDQDLQKAEEICRDLEKNAKDLEKTVKMIK